MYFCKIKVNLEFLLQDVIIEDHAKISENYKINLSLGDVYSTGIFSAIWDMDF